MMNKIFAIYKWVIKMIIKNQKYVIYIDFWKEQTNKWLNTRGSFNTVKRIKSMRLHVTRFWCGQPLMESGDPSIGLDSRGLPKNLGILRELILSNDIWDRRVAHTLLLISRAIPCNGEISVTSITDKGPDVNPDLLKEYSSVLKELNWTIPVPTWSECHLSTKSGPNSQAMIGSIADLNHLPQSLRDDISVLGGPELTKVMDLLFEKINVKAWNRHFKVKDKSLIRKLSVVSDPEGKERVIAIFDYWSQTALKPLHDNLFELLSRIKGDCTFNHSAGRNLSDKAKGPYYSMDLTAATDRFPIWVQRHVISELISVEYADSWSRVMTSHEFSAPFADSPINYGVGQPMGAYSSWSAFSLCHHLTVRIAAKRAGLSSSWSKYILLGDDIVLTNPKVADEYQKLMATLGVSLSPTKTHVSKDTYEFAKRWYHEGNEITGIQLGPFLAAKNWGGFASALHEFTRWGIKPHEVEPGSIAAGLRALGFERLRDTHKIQTFLHIPTKGDSPEDRSEKSIWLINKFFKSEVGCNRQVTFKEKFVLQTLAEVKTACIETAIKLIAKELSAWQQSLPELASLGLVDQTVLLAMPPVAVCRKAALELQSGFDKLRSAYWDLDEDIVFGEIPIRGVNPSRVNSVRAKEVLLATKVLITNRYSRWSRDYRSSRDHLLSDKEYSGRLNDKLPTGESNSSQEFGE
uniref:RNA-dependent RNA polymerase n=1 Tax=Entomophthora muscae mitovirus 2 TaxID=2557975 RepID=A0A4D6PB22_9VIRU|nr:RNA-dependent RNA polymerase [Entomophthora muscae mitovirus 2]